MPEKPWIVNVDAEHSPGIHVDLQPNGDVFIMLEETGQRIFFTLNPEYVIEQAGRIRELESELAISIRGHEQDTERHVEEIRLLRQELAGLKDSFKTLEKVDEGMVKEIARLQAELAALKADNTMLDTLLKNDLGISQIYAKQLIMEKQEAVDELTKLQQSQNTLYREAVDRTIKAEKELAALKDRLLIEEQYRITTEPAYMKRECVLEEELAALKSRLAEQLHKQDNEREQAAVVIDTLEKEIAAARTLRCDKCSRWIDTEYYSECPACKNVELKTKLDDANMAADHNADEWVIVTRKMEKALAIIYRMYELVKAGLLRPAGLSGICVELVENVLRGVLERDA